MKKVTLVDANWNNGEMILMPNLFVEKTLGKNDGCLTKASITKFIKSVEKKWIQPASIDYAWVDEQKIAFTGKGFKGIIKFSPKNIAMYLDLSIFLWPFKRKIEDTIEKEMSNILPHVVSKKVKR